MFNNTRLSRWWALLALPRLLCLPFPQANTRPLPPPAVDWWEKINSMSLATTAARWSKAIAKNITWAFSPLRHSQIPGIDPYVLPRRQRANDSAANAAYRDAPREGIVINLAELRLYYYQPGKNTVNTHHRGCN